MVCRPRTGPVSEHLRVQGLKIHLDNGSGAILLWEKDGLTGTIGRANAAGWQVSVHAVSTEAMEMVLDAYEAAIGPNGPNPLHHRIEHALQVTDDQLARVVAMDLAIGGPARRGRDRLGAMGGDGRRRDTFVTTKQKTSAGSAGGGTSSTPGCMSPERPTRHGSSRTLP